jgi:membrane protein DedA with SNARE-associated domain
MDALADLMAIYSNALANGANVHWGLWAYLILALLVLIEGPIATLVGAAAAAAGYLNPLLVFIAASAGNLTADFLWYRLGYLGKLDWLVRLGRVFKVRRAHVERLTEDVDQHARKLLVIAKLSLSLAIPALIATGVAKVPWRKWFGVVFLTEMLWTGTLVVAGVQFTRLLPRLESWLQVLAIIMLTLSVSLIGRYAYRIAKEWSDISSLEESDTPR